ncbi:hypothetical protein Sps_03931 [Shewanella psychrophila]|uniref:Common pilus major fimbrillin subunit EcpA n=1 Tax=Shewanella psychrophila TaxID=225848 RepID=A0A1S6HU08_9GAMM|nr:hypothetical protein [Shewanella psychrophila]AQS39046.1 hypothetical protein Sps_03931 [Shewanella psychrophila]
MKNIFKIATISALVMLSANAMAEDANQDFTWTGTVPAASAGTGIKIKATGSGTALDAGVFDLVKTADNSNNPAYGFFDITSPSLLSFDVVTDDASEDHVDYYYTMTSFLYTNSAGTSDGMIQGAFDGVDLTADGVSLQQDVKTTTAATASTDLTLTGNGLFQYGDEYTITATMLITDQAL